MMRGPMMHGQGRHGMGPAGDSARLADMRLVHELLMRRDAIRRSVLLQPNGIETLTESDDPHVVALITVHVVSMEQRLLEGRLFNMTSTSLPTIFANRDRIRTTLRPTANGVAVVQSSDDSATVAALHAHAGEVSELLEKGMHAMMGDACPMMMRGTRGPGAADSAGRPHRHH
jgi:hypothetical protein